MRINPFVVLLLFVLAGCSGNPIKEAYHQRELLFAPEPLNTAATKPAFAEGYERALVAAQGNPTPDTIAAYIDAGNALSARNCTEWLTRVTLARRGIVLSDHNLGVASSLLTTLAGIGKWNPAAVATLGAAEVATQGLGSNLQADVLMAPSQYQAQATLLGLLGQCSDQLLADAPDLKFSQAYSRLETCNRICSFDAAAAAANEALAATPVLVQPSGALRAVRP